MFYDNEEWWKILKGIDLPDENWPEEFNKFWPKHLKISKMCTLMGWFWPKCIMFELEKYRGPSLISRNIYTKCEGNLTGASKNDMRKILKNFHQSTFESLKIGTLIASFCLNLKMYELKICRRVLCHGNEEWCKIWRGIHFLVQNWHEEFDEFWPRALKNLKILYFNGLL